MFNQTGIKAKLIMAFAGTAMVSVIVGGIAFYASSRVVGEYRSIAKDNVPNLRAFINLRAAQSELVIPVASLAGTNSSPEDAAKSKQIADETIATFNDVAKLYEASPFAEGEEKSWESFKKDAWKPFVDMSFELIRLSGTNNKADQKLRDKMYETDFQVLRKSRKEAFSNLVEFQLKDVDKKEKQGDSYYNQMTLMIVTIVTLGFLCALGLGFMIASYLSRELNRAAESMTKGSEEVNLAVTQLSSAVSELSASSHQQAAAVQETAASVEQINAMVQKNSQSAAESAQVSDQSRKKAEDGKHAVDRMVRSMADIHEGNQKIQDQITISNQKFSEIVNVIREIGGKTKVINDIVFQTKLLSFNASVEAARAGEHGKGFAVVAEEVGSLAQMSGAASVEISSLLDESIKKVESVVNETKDTIGALILQARENVDRGNETATECGQTLEQIVDNVRRLSEMVGGIASASQEQSHGVEEITKAVQEIDQATQANASASEQTSSSVNQLSSLVGDLQDGSGKLRALVSGETYQGHELQQNLKAAPKPASRKESPVLAFKKKAAAPKARVKKVSGADFTPSADDPGFEEV